MFWVGVDIGGTFTDLVAFNVDTGEFFTTKTSTDPRDMPAAVIGGIKKLGVSLGEVFRICHGTTIATNAILERKGSKVALLTTKGFRDILEVGRGDRPVNYDIRLKKPPPLVPRRYRFEVKERTLFDKTILMEAEKSEIEEIVSKALTEGIEGVAICFLHSFINPDNEKIARKIVKDLHPEVHVSISSEVVPEIKEYERFSTTVLNAYIAKPIDNYLTRLEENLRREGYRHDLLVMTSSGGMLSANTARDFPVHLVLSGPAGGVAGTVHIAGQLGEKDIISYDMGGTSTDVCLIRKLSPSMTSEARIEGYPNKTLQIQINTIGAGGGSIAWMDLGNMLNVGPRSAGSYPGPVCYGRGGEEPTVTDANLILGRLNATTQLAGEIALDYDLSLKAISEFTRSFPGLDEFKMAEGIVRIAVTKMTNAIKEITLAKGHDPRDFTLVAFGGAGPMHATMVARELGIRKIIVPPAPGNLSALGMLSSDIRCNLVKTRIVDIAKLSSDDAEQVFEELEKEAMEKLAKEGVRKGRMAIERILDMRYRGQWFETPVPVPKKSFNFAGTKERFHKIHFRTYGHLNRKEAVEIVNFRVLASGRMSKPSFKLGRRDGGKVQEYERRKVYFDGQFVDTPAYRRENLAASAFIDGPAIVEEHGATTVVTPGFFAKVDDIGNLVVTAKED